MMMPISSHCMRVGGGSSEGDYGAMASADMTQEASQEPTPGTNQGDGTAAAATASDSQGKQTEQPHQPIQSNQFGPPSQFGHEQSIAGGVGSDGVNQQQLQPLQSGPPSFNTTSGHSEQPLSSQQPPIQQQNIQQQ